MRTLDVVLWKASVILSPTEPYIRTELWTYYVHISQTIVSEYEEFDSILANQFSI